MMTGEKCPNCGANIAPYDTVCKYCGSTLSGPAKAHWIAIKDQEPPPSSADPTRSEYVLTCDASDSQDQLSYGYSVMSSYLNMSDRKWKNELYNDKIDKDPCVTHWMALPPIDNPAWISVRSQKPTEPVVDPYQDEDPIYTIHVLVCDKSATEYEASIKSAQHSLDRSMDYWYSNFPEQNLDDIDYGVIDVSHWMNLPAMPSV